MNDELAQRLERLERIEAAKVAVARYGRAIDAKDLGALADEVFTPDVLLRIPGAEYRGTEDVIAFFRGAFEAAPGTRRHFLANHVAEPVGDDTVDIASYFFFVSADDESVIGWGAYRDLVVVRDGVGWTAEKTIELDVATTLDQGWAAVAAVGGEA